MIKEEEEAEKKAASALCRLRAQLKEKTWNTHTSHDLEQLIKKDCGVKQGCRFIYLQIELLGGRQTLSRKSTGTLSN